jgi:hypothetical protein
MKKLILATVVTILFAACSEKPKAEKVETKPSIVYELNHSGDTSILTVADFESESVNFVFLDSTVTATGMTYDNLAKACQASMKESKNWLLYPENFKYKGDSEVKVENGAVFVIVNAEILGTTPVEEAPTSFLIKANQNGTIDPYRAFTPVL